jgi:carbon storage regulator
MLVLSRKKDEKLVIGDDIEVTIVEVKGETVRIGISAPPEIKIYRGELLDAIREAARQPAPDLAELDRKLKSKKTE